jgi:hypothetical protein
MSHNEEALLAGLKALAASDTSAPPPSLEAALLSRLAPPKKKGMLVPWPLVLEAIAAATIIAIALGGHSAPEPAPNDFVAVPFVEPIGPNERSELVRVNLPVTALVKWGVPVAGLDPSQRVNADLVLGEDGLARAVRLISTE